MAKLVFVPAPGSPPQVVPLGSSPITMGREPENEMQLEGLEVSRRHCRIEPLAQGGYRILDLKSKNGTFLNGRQVSAMALDFQDQIRVGDSLIVYVEDDVSVEEALSRLDSGTSWLPISSEPSSLVLEDDSEEGSTWRSSRSDLRGPHTRSSNRSYLKERLLRLGMLTQNIASAPDLSRLMDTILDEVLDFTGFERGLLLLGEEDATGASTRLQPVLGRYMDHEHLEDAERRFSKGLVEEALREKRITMRSGLGTMDDSFSLRESVISMGLESALCIPLHIPKRVTARHKSERRRRRRSRRVLGAIYLDSQSNIRQLDKADLKLLEAVAAQAAIALQNARLHHQATTDPLTGLHNRAFLRQVFEEELRQAREETHPIGVILLDLDHFKRVNDTHGHHIGDEVLKRVAQRIRRTIRRDDYASRWGGEEFVILLPSSDEKGTLVVADKIAKAIKGTPIGEVAVKVTASLGVSVFPAHGDSPSLLIKRADQALYAAKAAGRDRVKLFTPDLDHTGHRVDPFEGLFDGDPAHAQRNLKAIFDTIDLLRSSETEPREILERTLDNVVDLTRARRALLIVADAEGELEVCLARRQGGRNVNRLLEFSRSTVQMAVNEQRSLCLLDSDDNSRLTSSSIDRLGLNTVMCVPLKVENETIGALYADDTVANREFGEKDLAHLEMIAHQLSLTMATNPALYAAACGRTKRDEPGKEETQRLRDEVQRLRDELNVVKGQTKKFKRMLREQQLED